MPLEDQLDTIIEESKESLSITKTSTETKENNESN